MKKCLKARLALATFTAVAGLSFTGCKDSVRYEKYANAQQYAIGNASYSSERVKKVDIDWLAGSIDIEQSTTGAVEVVETEGLSEEAQRMHYYLDGNVLRVKYCESGLRGSIREGNKNLRVAVPSGVALDIDSTNAVVTAEGGIEVTNFSLESVSGNLTAERIVCNEADLETVSGKMTIGSLLATRCRLETVSGSCNVGLAVDFLDAETSSGEFHFLLQKAAKAEVETTTGNVTLSVGELGGRINFDSALGSFHCDKEYGKAGSWYDIFDGNGQAIGFDWEIDTFTGGLTVR